MAFGNSASAGDRQVYISDPALQGDVAGTPVEGALPKPAGDFLQVVDSNLTASKANADLVRNVSYRVKKGKDGAAVATLDITYANNGAATDVNPYYNGYLRVYVPKGATLAEER